MIIQLRQQPVLHWLASVYWSGTSTRRNGSEFFTLLLPKHNARAKKRTSSLPGTCFQVLVYVPRLGYLELLGIIRVGYSLNGDSIRQHNHLFSRLGRSSGNAGSTRLCEQHAKTPTRWGLRMPAAFHFCSQQRREPERRYVAAGTSHGSYR